MSTSSSPQPLAAGWVPVPGSPLYSAVQRYRPNCVSAKVPEVTAADPAESADTMIVLSKISGPRQSGSEGPKALNVTVPPASGAAPVIVAESPIDPPSPNGIVG